MKKFFTRGKPSKDESSYSSSDNDMNSSMNSSIDRSSSDSSMNSSSNSNSSDRDDDDDESMKKNNAKSRISLPDLSKVGEWAKQAAEGVAALKPSQVDIAEKLAEKARKITADAVEKVFKFIILRAEHFCSFLFIFYHFCSFFQLFSQGC